VPGGDGAVVFVMSRQRVDQFFQKNQFTQTFSPPPSSLG
jgi:hypothetical protein